MISRLEYNPARRMAKVIYTLVILTGFGCTTANHRHIRPTEPEPTVSSQDSWREVHNDTQTIESVTESKAPVESVVVDTSDEALIAEQTRIYNALLEEEGNQPSVQPRSADSYQPSETQVIIIEQEVEPGCGCRRHWGLIDRCQFHRRLHLRQRRAQARRQARRNAERSARQNARAHDRDRSSRRARRHERREKKRRAQAKRQRRIGKTLAKKKLKKRFKKHKRIAKARQRNKSKRKRRRIAKRYKRIKKARAQESSK